MSAARMNALPDGYFHCKWCRGGVRYNSDGSWPSRCPHCKMHPHPSPVDETVGGKVDPAKAKASARNRRGAARIVPLRKQPIGQPVWGVDPGAKYTGVILRDGDAVLHATTIVRPDGLDAVGYGRLVTATLQQILATAAPGIPMGVEGVSDPKGFKHGRRESINPKDIIRAGITLGAVSNEFREAVVVDPGGNGSQHITHYPPELVGARPPDLPGSTNQAGTRAHEQSAYDVAGKAAKIHYPSSPANARLAEGLRR